MQIKLRIKLQTKLRTKLRTKVWRVSVAVWLVCASFIAWANAASQTKAGAGTESGSWQKAVAAITPTVVSLKINHTRAFDENWNQSTHATGFVVDAKRGIILTNRHVVGPGPSTAQAVFQNKEEVELERLYTDPVHDFGFYRFNPADLKHFDVVAAELAPGAARVGMQIRVIGNDAGEQLSILDGTLARLDRAAPDYGYGKYNDFNTFYFQAASSSSGGSSGSPVINQSGQVVALNAGSRNRAATSYFLPLPRIVAALRLLQAGQPIERGTLLTTFTAKTYAELSKLGLAPATEQRFRDQFPNVHTLLVVDHLLPGTPSAEHLKVGDILLELNNHPISSFLDLAQQLDTNVRRDVTICVQRAGVDTCLELPVADLHTHTPMRYVEYDGAVLQDLTYQRARHFNRPRVGVYVADPGFGFAQAGVTKGALITEMNGVEIAHLDDLIQVLRNAKQAQEVSLRYLTLDNNQAVKYTTLPIEFRWFPAAQCTPRSEPHKQSLHQATGAGTWRCAPLVDALVPGPAPNQAAVEPGQSSQPSTPTKTKQAFEPTLEHIANSLVHVRFNAPYPLSGNPSGRRSGTGLIVDPIRGWVLTSRTIVSSSAANVYLTFNREEEISGRVAFLHPSHNLALIQFDPSEVTTLPTQPIKLQPERIQAGDQHTIIGVDSELKFRKQSAVVAEIEPLQMGISSPPRFQTSNTDVVQYVNGPTDFSGVVLNSKDEVVGLYQKFEQHKNGRTRAWSRGIDARMANAFIKSAQSQQPWYDLGAQWFPINLARAKKIGLPQDWVTRLGKQNQRPHELTRSSVPPGNELNKSLLTGDLLLAIDGQTVDGLMEIDLLTQKRSTTLTILRNGQVMEVVIQTKPRQLVDMSHIVFWAGALIQPPPLMLSRERQLPLEGVYVSFYRYGSPASRGGLVASLTITQIDDMHIHDMDDFLKAIRTLEGAPNVRVRARHLNQLEKLITLRLDPHYWPAYELRRVGDEWQRNPVTRN